MRHTGGVSSFLGNRYLNCFPYKETHFFDFIQFPSCIAQLCTLVAHPVGPFFTRRRFIFWTILTAEPSQNEQEESWIQWSLKTRSAQRTGQWSSGSSKETAERRGPLGAPPSRTQGSTSRCAR